MTKLSWLISYMGLGSNSQSVSQPFPMSKIFELFRDTRGRQLGPLEQQLLQLLWERGNGTVRELVDDAGISLAYTTVMTTLDRLYKKQVLDRVPEGRAFRYWPRLSPEQLQRAAAGEAIRQLLASNEASTLPLSCFVEAITEYDAKLLDRLQELVEQKRRELRNPESH